MEVTPVTLTLTPCSSESSSHEEGSVCTSNPGSRLHEQAWLPPTHVSQACLTPPASSKDLDLPSLHHGPHTVAFWSLSLCTLLTDDLAVSWC